MTLGFLHLPPAILRQQPQQVAFFTQAEMGRLHAIGYDAWCTVEAFSTKVDGIRQAANVHRDAFESRETVVREALPFMREITQGGPSR